MSKGSMKSIWDQKARESERLAKMKSRQKPGKSVYSRSEGAQDPAGIPADAKEEAADQKK